MPITAEQYIYQESPLQSGWSALIAQGMNILPMTSMSKWRERRRLTHKILSQTQTPPKILLSSNAGVLWKDYVWTPIKWITWVRIILTFQEHEGRLSVGTFNSMCYLSPMQKLITHQQVLR